MVRMQAALTGARVAEKVRAFDLRHRPALLFPGDM